MKLITAIIQPGRLDVVREALLAAEISRITVSRCVGHGRSVPDMDLYRGQEIVPNLVPKIRIDIAVNDEFVELAVNAILDSAPQDEGAIGDGKVFITPLEECVRIRTKERGGEAI
jgi:nitrogen regulatory protein P-II 1